MTDDKSKTPGMAEVSAKFVHEPVATLAPDPLLAMRAERKQTEAEVVAAPEGELGDLRARVEHIETRILLTEPRTLLGALVQIEVLVSMADEGIPDFALEPLARVNEQLSAHIDGLLAGATEDPVLALKREWEARYKDLDENRDDPDADDSDKAVQPFFDRLHETETQILRTQATTPAGIAVKLILWARLQYDADEVSGLNWTRKSIEGHPYDLDRLPVMSALLDLERMAGKGQS